MKILKKSIIIILTFVLLSIQVSASNNNIINMNKTETDKLIVDLIYAAAEGNVNKLNDKALYFESDCFYDMYSFVSDNDIDSNSVGEIVIDFTYPDNSSTGDIVIMANTKIWHNNREYNNAHLFEFHINSNGEIYGFNFWTY